jgi:sugar fermentation stimulation protein A
LNVSCETDWTFELPAHLSGRFLKRPNRFLALVEAEGRVLEAHVHDPGRLPQILFPGNKVLLRRASGTRRRTSWDLIAGQAAGFWVLVHSGYHRPLIETLLKERGGSLFPGLVEISPEPSLNHGRLDYLLRFEDGSKLYVETKGCTLTQGERALFPDAPTQRGKRHLETLISLVKKGMRSLIWLLVFRPETSCFTPAWEIDPQFAETFHKALSQGVELKITKFLYDGRKISLMGDLPLCEELNLFEI